MTNFNTALAAIAAEVDAVIDGLLPTPDGDERRLADAMRYSVLGPGKRLRPFLVAVSADLFGVPRARSLRVGAALECVHAYSLVHDDLPAMDDDDLRRGRPTTHKAFDEATAILAGDALQALAFEILAEEATHPDAGVRVGLVRELARGAGLAGMCGGQALDLSAGRGSYDFGGIARLERLKTGALIAFACEAGAILGQASGRARAALFAYAMDVGFAFQIADDLLDHEGDEAAMGKRLRKDDAAGKATVVSLLGLEGARAEAARLVAQGVAHLEQFGSAADLLRETAAFVIERRR